MRYLAFDLATRCGWAKFADGRFDSGRWTNPHRYSDSPGAFMEAFNSWLTDMRAWHNPTVLVWEQPMVTHGPSEAWALMAAGMVTRLQERAFKWDCVQAHVRPNTLKKWATGSGKAGKDSMMAAMRERWGRTTTDDNEADALAVLAWAVENVTEEDHR